MGEYKPTSKFQSYAYNIVIPNTYFKILLYCIFMIVVSYDTIVIQVRQRGKIA